MSPVTGTTSSARRVVLLVAAALSLAAAAVASPAAAAPGYSDQRLFGPDRYATAAAVAGDYLRDVGEGDALSFLLARGDDPTDSLAASFVTGVGPLLLTRTDALPAATADLLGQVNADAVDEVLVLGGTGAVSDDVVRQVEALGYRTRRLAGPDRFATAVRIAAEVPQDDVPDVRDLGDAAFLASGRGFADALAAGTVSCAGPPTLLTEKAFVPQATAQALGDRGIDVVFVLGGPGAVDQAVVAYLEDQDLLVARLSGPDRWATAAAVTGFGLDEGLLDPSTAVVTRGDAFPDALSAGSYGCGAPLVLTAPTSVSPGSAAQLDLIRPDVVFGTVIGGSGAVSESVRAEITNRLRS